MPRDSIRAKWARTLSKIRALKNWYRFVLPETKFPYRQNATLRLRNGLWFHTRNSSFDLPILLQIFTRNIYDNLHIKGASPAILDIGGHIGMFAAYAARKNPSARIISFEPDPANHSLFIENMTTNLLADRVTLIPKAVAAEAGERNLFVNPLNSSMNNFFHAHPARGMTDSIRVACVTLEDIIRTWGGFDVAKFDCEGAEYEVLLTASDETLRALPYLIIEWHASDAHTPEDLAERLRNVGYHTTYSKKPRIITARK